MHARIPLNPCDYLYYTQHELMRRRGLVGCPILMVLDVSGPLDAARLDAAVTSAMNAHPTLCSRIRVGLLSGRPSYRPTAALDEPPLRVHDAPAADWPAAADRIAHAAFNTPIDPHRCPQFRIDLVRGPDRSRLCLTWPHALTDAEGGQWLVHELDRLDRGAPRPSNLRTDPLPLDPLAGRAWPQRIRRFVTGMSDYRRSAQDAAAFDASRRPPPEAKWRFALRAWNAAETQAIRQRAAFWCPTGQSRFARYLAGCVLRALWRIRAADTPSLGRLLITLPLRAADLPAQRPLCGNYLVSATLRADASAFADKRRLMDDLDRDVAAFTTEHNRNNWAMIWMAGLMRSGQYRYVLGHPRWGYQPYASGFSYYGEIDPPIRTFLGRPVENFWGTTTMPVPPGWNPAFARFADRLNFVLSWLDGYIPREMADNYARQIETELFE